MSTARRRMAHLLAALCLACIPVVLVIPASADSVGSFGWWYRLNQGAPIPVPPPPNAPDGGIYLQNVTGAGQNAMGAVQFVNQTATAGTVKFGVSSVNGPAEVALCAATSPWIPDQAGTWDDRPEFDCDGPKGKVIGVFNDDNTELTFAVTDKLATIEGVYDLVVVADPVVDSTFELGLTLPAGTFFTPTSTSPPTVPPVSEPTPQPTFSPPSQGSDPGSGDSFGQPVDDGGNSADLGGFLDEPEATPDVPVDDGGEIADGGGETFDDSSGEFAGEPVAQKGPSTTGERIAAAFGLGLLALALWVIGTRGSENLDPALAQAGALTAAGGVGRFARVRTRQPTRLT